MKVEDARRWLQLVEDHWFVLLLMAMFITGVIADVCGKG